VPNFVEIVQTTTEICQFSIFQDGGRRHLGFFKFQTSDGLNGQEGRTASPGQISSKSLETRPRYDYFMIFENGGLRHLEFSKLQIFNGRNGQKCVIVHVF